MKKKLLLERFEAAGLNCISLVPEEDKEYPLVILLHGWGDWGESYPQLGAAISASDYRFVFPTGPVSVPGAMNGWFMLDEYLREFARSTASVRPRINNLLDELLARFQTPANRTVLGGFSQGGMVAFDAGLRYRGPGGELLAGLIALSSVLPSDDPDLLPDLQKALDEAANSNLPVFVAHGTDDPLLPVTLGRATRDTLQEAKLDVEYYEFPGYHEISLEELQEIQKFLKRVLG